MTIPKPITDAAQAILTRLDAAYSGVDPDDIDAITAIWIELLSEDTDDEPDWEEEDTDDEPDWEEEDREAEMLHAMYPFYYPDPYAGLREDDPQCA